MKKNMDLVCALHLDRPHHLHIHFTFFEKEPRFPGKNNTKVYRAKGKVDKKAIHFAALSRFPPPRKML